MSLNSFPAFDSLSQEVGFEEQCLM
jgi:hypothetical protein